MPFTRIIFYAETTKKVVTSFDNKVKILPLICHKNVVKMYGVAYGSVPEALFLEYMTIISKYWKLLNAP